eukprot:GEMP01025789.1.p1 GENE.GEMP01025789.1~~GEMP01025789.1.p1  ORF type:complete len:271 (+),score=51.35 GEMP01025789.1:55-867(+)
MWRTQLLRCNRVSFGPHKGKTFDEVIHQYPSYVEFLEQQWPTAETRKFLEYSATIRKQHRSENSNAPSVASTATASSSSMPPSIPSTSQTGLDARSYFDAAPRINGSNLMTFGRHAGLTFENAFQLDSAYCQFLVKAALEEQKSDDVLRFVCYVQRRWLEPKTTLLTVEAPQKCLTGQAFALIGSGGDFPRADVKKCLEFFGATVMDSVSKRSRGVLVLQTQLPDGRPVESCVNYMDALEKGVEIIPIAKFLQERLHRPGPNCVTFKLSL